MRSPKTAESFKPVNPKVNFPSLEEEVLQYWKEKKTFEKSVQFRPENKRWTFLDGPPFVTGMPHYGSLLSSLPKDLFGRYWTMKGYRVRRVWGWDGHGLPIENKVENELKIARKRDIEEVIGVKKFIDECKRYVNVVSSDWEWYVDHIGRWVDFKNAYRTWDIPYMESVMWVFKQMYEKGLIYKGLRVSLYCPHCSTPISNFEVAMDADNYKEVIDAATTYKYELVEDSGQTLRQIRQAHRKQAQGKARMTGSGKTYILAWSTTPWNKIVTPALAVNPELTYVKVRQGLENYILAKSALKILMSQSSHSGLPRIDSGVAPLSGAPQNDNKVSYKILDEFKGAELVGKKFVPHYDYYSIAPGEKAFEIIGGDFVTAEEGAGVVTIASYGEEDLKAMKEHNIHIETHLDEEGTIKPDVPLFGGMYYLKANKVVNEDLAKRGLIYKDENLPHNVPLCWRCHTRLYYAPIDAWFVNVQELKEKMKDTNEKVNWFPSHFKYGRFLKSLENAPDWNISRNRYWGSPVPVWECECGERFVPGSIKELEERSGQHITELHKPEIDEVTVKCDKCRKTVKRVTEVLDSWIEAGSASFAERHFPFDQTEKLEQFFPPDYIAEYTGQIRAWFYVLHVIGAALYESNAFKNVSVTGVILGSDGRKMSKNFKNYPDPKEMLQTYGGDALRLYLFGSPVMNGEDILISQEQYRNQVKGMMLILWNTYNFFVSYANVDGWNSTNNKQPITNNILDKWILSLLNGLIQDVTDNLEQYDTVSAVSNITKFVNEFSTWYIRRSRERVGPSVENEEDKEMFYVTTYEVLTKLCLVIAPIAPFLAENMYRNLTGEESVHLALWPTTNQSLVDKHFMFLMDQVRSLVEAVHATRKKSNIKVRQPLNKLSVFITDEKFKKFKKIIKEELNIKNVEFKWYEDLDKELKLNGANPPKFILDTEITSELKAEGQARDIIRQIQEERKKLGTRLDELVNVTLPSWPKEFEKEIKRKALIQSLSEGDTLQVARV